MDTIELAISLILLIIGGVIAYFIGLKVARRQRQHEMMAETYGTLYFALSEIAKCIEWASGFQNLDLANDGMFMPNFLTLAQPIFLLGDRDTFIYVSELEEEFNLKLKKDRHEFLEAMREYISSFLWLETRSIERDSRRESASLAFLHEYLDIKEKYKDAMNALESLKFDSAIRGIMRKAELPIPVPETDIAKLAQNFGIAMENFRVAVDNRLSRIL
jgi:hypothetical protein